MLGRSLFRFGRHSTSEMSLWSTRIQRLVLFHSPFQFLGSVIVYSICNVLPFVDEA